MKKILITGCLLACMLCLITAQISEFWGMTTHGGPSDAGTIFKTDGNGNFHQTVHNFRVINEGSGPGFGGLCEAADGKIYGLTIQGGMNNLGVMYVYDPNDDTYTTKIDFDFMYTGGNPAYNLLRATNGKIYGLTWNGGASFQGTLFEYDPASDGFDVKVNLDNIMTGSAPSGGLLEAGNGRLYGMMQYGGEVGYGVLFEFDPQTAQFSKCFDFRRDSLGGNPAGNLVLAGNGKLYGVTRTGGINDKGILFEFNPETFKLNKKFDMEKLPFYGRLNGYFIPADNGGFYGLTSGDQGELVEYNTEADSFRILFAFRDEADGVYPRECFLKAGNGKLYGVTVYGGKYDWGVLFEYDLEKGLYTKKFDFDYSESGAHPVSSLMLSSEGMLYGTTVLGGYGDHGTLYAYDLGNERFRKLVDFSYAEYGCEPAGTCVYSQGTLYGFTYRGGKGDDGVLFGFDTHTHELVKKVDFPGGDEGSRPMGGLTLSKAGKIYGTVVSGGIHNKGGIYAYDVSGDTYTLKVSSDSAGGFFCSESLVEAADGKLYGMMSHGGTWNGGTIFCFDPQTDIYSKLYDFPGGVSGYFPMGGLCLTDEGMLCGATYNGGTHDCGVIFTVDPQTGAYTKRFEFDTLSGANPVGSMVRGADGQLYGVTWGGGRHMTGVLYAFNPGDGSFSKKVDFDWYDKGVAPSGGLMSASNGKIYGLTFAGGMQERGVLFEYDVFTGIFTKKLDFTTASGGMNETSLTEVAVPVRMPEHTAGHAARVYPNPGSGPFILDTGGIFPEYLLMIRDASGKILEASVYHLPLVEVNIAGPGGLYFLEIVSDSRREVIRVVKE